MKKSSSESQQLIDQLAATAHEMINRVHERAAKMEDNIGTQSKETSKRLMAGMEREVSGLEKYIEENPMMAAMFAFGIGAFASRAMKAMSKPTTETTQTEETKPAKKASVSKAA